VTALSQLNFRSRLAVLHWARLALLPASLGLAFYVRGVGGVVAGIVFGVALNAAIKAWQQSARRQFVREARFPPFLLKKLQTAYPQLATRDAELVLRGLRQFFMAHLRSDRKFVAMPSKLVDEAWHAFILHTRGYEQWCQAAFGALLHHTPAEVLTRQNAKRNDGLRRTWYWACKEESIDPRKPSRLPLLFALDGKFGVAGGFAYVADCRAIDQASSADTYCGTSFSESGGGSGDAGGFGGSESSSAGATSDSTGSSNDGGTGDSGSDSGSDGGSGCGGGGCGGGGD
jgi:hypothetical protein